MTNVGDRGASIVYIGRGAVGVVYIAGLDPFCRGKKNDVRWGKFDPLSFTMALLDIDTALVWMYFSPIFSFEKEAGIQRKKKDMVARKTAP